MSEASNYVDRLGFDFIHSKSTGCQVSDYFILHSYILKHRPKVVLEFGSGCSTIVIADALKQSGGHLFTYEAIKEFHTELKVNIPNELKDVITPVYAPSTWTEFMGIRGVRYDVDMPVNAELVFVDGPIETLASGFKGTCLDLLFLLKKYPSNAVDVLVDRKFSSLIAYSSLLPSNMVCYDPVYDLGFIKNVKGAQLLGKPRDCYLIPHRSVRDSLAL